MSAYDALLLVAFGGPEHSNDVVPFLENVVRGKRVPRERILAVARHYDHFGGVSPINAQNRALVEAIRNDLRAHQLDLPVYWGNRHWSPLLGDTLRQMANDGIRHALAFVSATFDSPYGCRQYMADIEQARQQAGSSAPQVDKLRSFYNHPGFLEPMVARVEAALAQIPVERRAKARLVFTAHSLPLTMARCCPYQEQYAEACRLVSQRVACDKPLLAYQSRSGRPSEPWLGPDIGEALRTLAAETPGEPGTPGRDVVVIPIGFLCEHMETVYDLDIAARAVSDEVGLMMVRAMTVQQHPRFVRMIRELVLERLDATSPRLALGDYGASPDVCLRDCQMPPS